MPSWLKGLLTVVFACAISSAGFLLYRVTVGKLLAPHPGGTEATLIAGLFFGLIYGLMAGILLIYDLASGAGWVALVLDLTWSLPNTIFGFVIGNLVYPLFGAPSRAESEDKSWIVYMPRASGGFGHSMLQTLGTVNLGGAGQHERMHLLQARVFGPLYLPLFGINYVITFCLQVIWTLTLGGILALAKVRNTAYFRPPASSAVQGFFGWIYHSTVFELWAYASGNP